MTLELHLLIKCAGQMQILQRRQHQEHLDGTIEALLLPEKLTGIVRHHSIQQILASCIVLSFPNIYLKICFTLGPFHILDWLQLKTVSQYGTSIKSYSSERNLLERNLTGPQSTLPRRAVTDTPFL